MQAAHQRDRYIARPGSAGEVQAHAVKHRLAKLQIQPDRHLVWRGNAFVFQQFKAVVTAALLDMSAALEKQAVFSFPRLGCPGVLACGVKNNR